MYRDFKVRFVGVDQRLFVLQVLGEALYLSVWLR